MHLLRYNFTPKWYSIVITLLLLPLLISLGLWQMNRAQEKITLQQELESRVNGKAVTLSTLPAANQLAYQPITLSGHYDNQRQFLLDNRRDGRTNGYEILTPFVNEESQQMVLINRGFVAKTRDRRVLPNIAVDEQPTTVHGYITLPDKKAFTLKDVPTAEGWPKVIQIVKFPELQTLLGQTLYPFVVELRQPEIKGTSPAKHWGYAMQWFGLALTLFIIFIVVNTKRVSS